MNEKIIEKDKRFDLIDYTIDICDKIISLHADTFGDISKAEAIKDKLAKMKEN